MSNKHILMVSIPILLLSLASIFIFVELEDDLDTEIKLVNCVDNNDNVFANGEQCIELEKIYPKYLTFLKLFGLKNLKKIELKEEIYEKVQRIDGNKSWYEGIRFPEQSIAQGLLNPLQYKLAHLFNGFHAVEDIALEMNLPVEEVYKILKKIDELGLITYIEII